MSYERQYYTNGDVLEASHLNHMEAGIKENSDSVSKLSEDIANLKENGVGGGVTTEQANSLWDILQKSAFVEQLTEAELNAFKTAWGIADDDDSGETEVTLSSISATYSGGSVLVGTSVNDLNGITVKAIYSDGSKTTVTDYTLSGTIAEGSNTVTISYGGKSTTITVLGYVEEEPEITLTSISATYNGSDVTVGTALTSLTGITVTGTYSDGSTSTITGYTLSGEIVEGSNTITVSYGGKTTTFTVTGVAESSGDDSGGIVNLFDKNTMVVSGAFVGTNGVISNSATSKYAKVPVSVGTYSLQKGSGWSMNTTGHPTLINSNGEKLCVIGNLQIDGSGGSLSDSSISTYAKAKGNNGITLNILSEEVTHIIFSICVNGGVDDTDTTMVETGDTCHDYVAYV